MREIIEQILQEEQSARSRAEQAQNQARDIVLKAKEEAKSLIQDAVNKAKDLALSKKEEAEKTFLAQKEKTLKETRDGIALSREKKEKDIPKIAGDIFSKIITIRG